MVPVVDVVHAPTTASATEAYALSMGPPISAPVSGSISVLEQLGSASGGELEAPPTVSDHAVPTIVVTNYWSFSTCLRPPIVHYHLRCLMP